MVDRVEMEFVCCRAYDASASIAPPDFELDHRGNNSSAHWIRVRRSIRILISIGSYWSSGNCVSSLAILSHVGSGVSTMVDKFRTASADGKRVSRG